MAEAKPKTRKGNYHHGDLRGALLEAIRRLVERDGADRFSLAEACRIAGVSTAAPYKHFPDRPAMLRGVVSAAMDRLYDAMEAAAAAHPPGDPRRIMSLGQSYIRFARTEPGIFRLMFGLSEDHAEDPELNAKGEATNAMVVRIVCEHFGLEEETDEARLRAYALWCFVHGHSFLTIDGKREEAAADIPEDTLLALVGTSMLPEGAGRRRPKGT